jgi:hypothetical protein
MEHSKGSPDRKVYSHECVYKRTKRSQINDLMLHLKLLEKQEQANLKTSKRREIIKIKAKIYDIKEKTPQRINETKSWFSEKNKQD